MQCYRCNTIVDTENTCPHCGANIELYRRILLSGEILYNEGLEKAMVHDISGAIDSLENSLKYNKYNTKARNLLGLCYYEIGEMVLALREWVISKNFQPEDNEADFYLSEMQTNGELDRMNQTIKKYNQALMYCKQGSRDLAKIQLRRVIGMNPKFVKAYQLLALICIFDEDYGEARKALNEANRIDVKNATSLRYTKEVKAALKIQEPNKKKKAKDSVSFQDGNDTIVMPKATFRDVIDGNRSSVLNIIVGLIIGLLVCVFLIIPTVQQNARSDAANSLVSANNEAVKSKTNADTLQSEVDALQSKLDTYSTKGDTATSYEKLMEAQKYFDDGDYEKAAEALSVVNGEILGTSGMEQYQNLMFSVVGYQLENTLNAGIKAYNEKDYATAITSFNEVIALDATYKDGAAYYYLGDSYLKLDNIAEAQKCFNTLVESEKEGIYVDKAKKALEDIESKIENGALDDEI